MEERESAKLLYYLNMLNENWKKYDNLERGNTELAMGEKRKEMKSASTKYEYAELRLAELGWRWDQLDYDRATKTYSFPEQKPE